MFMPTKKGLGLKQCLKILIKSLMLRALEHIGTDPLTRGKNVISPKMTQQKGVNVVGTPPKSSLRSQDCKIETFMSDFQTLLRE